MKPLFWLVLVVGAAIAIPLIIGNGYGYVLLVQPPYRIELSTSFFLLLAVILFLGMHALLRLVSYTLRLPARVLAFKKEKREKEALTALLEGMTAFAEGRYAKAEKSASKALELGADALNSALLAARSAHKLKNYQRRDYYLAQAEELAPKAHGARLLCQAELLLDERQFQRAQVAIEALEKNDSQHLPALQLDVKIRRQLKDWEGVLALIVQLEKRGALESLLIQQWKLEAHLGLLARNEGNVAALKLYWQKLPEKDRLNPSMAIAAARHFVTAGDGTMAARIIEMSLTRQWDTALAEFYGECESHEPVQQLEQAEHWLKDHSKDAGLLLSLGKLCMRGNLWGKAQNYLEAGLSIKESSAAHQALAEIMEKNGNAQAALRHFKQSLLHSK